MPTSQAGKANNRCCPGCPAPARGAARTAGFTLVELLVVVTILSILALGVGLGAGGGLVRPGNTPRAVADRFAGAMTRARDGALLGRAPVGVVPRRDGWLVAMRDVDGAWRAAAPPVSVPGVALSWQVGGASYAPSLAGTGLGTAPPVVFLPDGQGTGFGVTIGAGGGQSAARIACRTDGWGPVTCD